MQTNINVQMLAGIAEIYVERARHVIARHGRLYSTSFFVAAHNQARHDKLQSIAQYLAPGNRNDITLHPKEWIALANIFAQQSGVFRLDGEFRKILPHAAYQKDIADAYQAKGALFLANHCQI